MANKQLTAKVRLNTKDAERSVDNLVRKINKMNNAMNRISNNNNTERQLTKNQQKVDTITNKVKQWANAQKQVTRNTKSTNNALSTIGSKLSAIASTYLGIMGTKAVVGATDLLVGAQNRLNYVNGGDTEATQDALDKMYASSQKVRTSYQDMISNVSKTMTLAGDAFQGNIDNAIRFQEIMAEAYAVGGASAQEMSTSMYQLTQALGSGILQGDELRSVREGAPLAYQAIEKFAQGVLGADESLKELAADGLITSEMVVAAIMDMGEGVDKAFANTRQTFGQTFDQLKNSALYAFQPVMEMLTDALNKAVDNGMIQRFESLFLGISKAIMIAFKAIEIGITWIADNWYWLQYIFYAGIVALTGYLLKLAAVAVWTALTSFWTFLTLNPFIIWIMAIGILVAALVWLLNSCSNACEAIIQLALIVAQAIVTVLMVVLAVYLATGTVMLSIPVLIGLVVVAVIALMLAAFLMYTGEIIGGALGIWEVIKAVCSWISTGWGNMCNNLSAWFYNAIADMLDGVDWLLKGINKIREALGMDAISVEGLRAKASASKAKVVENNLDIGGAWNTGYTKGYAIGTGIQNKINSFGEKIKGLANEGLTFDDKTSTLDKIGNKLGLDFSGMTAPFPSEGAGSGYSPDLDKLAGNVGDINGNTGKIADAMDLTEEDLEYLRKIADMEWKKEYTTANIVVDMTNNNNINGDGDLDGIVTRLADKLYEEMDYLANGVYA